MYAPAVGAPTRASRETASWHPKQECHGSLDTNAIGPKEAGMNLARSIKAMLAAANEENNP